MPVAVDSARQELIGNDKRLYARIKVRWPAAIVTKDSTIDGMIRNISVNGAFLYYDQPHLDALPPRRKQRLRMIIKVPGRLPLPVHIVVVWSEILSSDEANTLIGVNLRFLELFYHDREFLHKTFTKWLKKRWMRRNHPINSTFLHGNTR
jgi:hypothetical protein